MPDTPVLIERGQAGALLLIAEDGSSWILKRFRNGCALDKDYLTAVANVLPDHQAFTCGKRRQILAGCDLKRARGCYSSAQLKNCIDNAILMPRVAGTDWAGLADDLRAGSIQLDRDQRLTLALRICELTEVLEAADCAHRDFSGGNVFINVNDWTVVLIDFDSLYHPSLVMPPHTTCGTEGYSPAFVWHNGKTSAQTTWCTRADRFPLALLITEFLTLDRTAPQGPEGGMFKQDHLRARAGESIDFARARLTSDYAGACDLLDAAIHAQQCDQCPSPADWRVVLDRLAGPANVAPPLDTLLKPDCADMARILQRQAPAPPIWPAPNLNDLARVTDLTLTPPAGAPPRVVDQTSTPPPAAPSLASLEDPWA
jgi:hypothetical protein